MQSPDKGKLYVVGLGPGDSEMLTIKAYKALKESDYVIGYTTYLKRIEDIIADKNIIESGMRKEVERVKKAVELSLDHKVSIVSGGDPSIYGILPLIQEYLIKHDLDIGLEVIPGVTAVCAASPLLGSPISGDHAVISLSDNLTPWEKIERRLISAISGDFVIALYNPSSRKRKPNLVRAMELILSERGDIMVGVVKNACRHKQDVIKLKISELIDDSETVDMSTLLVVPNSSTVTKGGKMVTPRGYSKKYSF